MAAETEYMGKLKKYVTIKQAAEYLGVCPNTLRNWGASGKLKERRHPVNSYRLYKRADLDALLRKIEKSGVYPTGWPREAKRNRKPL
jgi:DNA (cytosine-5)-methyltransferase 1